MRRFMPSNRRLTTLAGAVFVGVAATAMFAAPASAWHADVSGKPTCDKTTGTFTIAWSLYNKEGSTATVDQAKFQVKKNGSWTDSTGTFTPIDVAGYATAQVATQSGLPSGTKAKLTVHVVWYKEGKPHTGDNILDQKSFSSQEYTCGTCQKETPPPPPTKSASPSASPSAKPSASGTAGGETSPTPSKSATAPALPVTGSQTGLLTGGAAVLLAGGAGLFVVARRRRLKFEA